MLDTNHMNILNQGVTAWNNWRKKHPEIQPNLVEAALTGMQLLGIDFSGTDLSGAHLEGANLSKAIFDQGSKLINASLCGAYEEGGSRVRFSLGKPDNNLGGKTITWTILDGAQFRGADLTGANLSGASLKGADGSGARMHGVNLIWAALEKAQFIGADLSEAQFYGSYLTATNLEGAQLINADFEEAKLDGTSLINANLTGANLIRATMTDCMVTNAIFDECLVYGISVWNMQGEPKSQHALLISRTSHDEARLTVDNLAMAQFVYLMLNNKNIRGVIDTVTTKAVLILGRFTTERKAVLDSLCEPLRKEGFLPIIFDFEKPSSRNLTETVETLASLSLFVIADLTDASSVPAELASIVPDHPSLVVCPIIDASQEPYAMFVDLLNYYSVLKLYKYNNPQALLTDLGPEIIKSMRIKRKELNLEQLKKLIP